MNNPVLNQYFINSASALRLFLFLFFKKMYNPIKLYKSYNRKYNIPKANKTYHGTHFTPPCLLLYYTANTLSSASFLSNVYLPKIF